MVKTVFFALVEQNLRRSGPDSALILIDGNGREEVSAPLDAGAVLRLRFDNISEESVGVPVGSVPDQNSCGGPLLTEDGRIWPDLNHAKEILRFVGQLPQSCERLLVYCVGGPGASASIVKFFVDNRNIPCESRNSCRWLMTNDRLTRLLDMAQIAENTNNRG